MLSSVISRIASWLRLSPPEARNPTPAPPPEFRPLSTPPPNPPSPEAPEREGDEAWRQWEKLWEGRLLLWGIGKRTEAENAIAAMLDEPLDDPSYLVEHDPERKLINALIIGRRREALSKFAQRVSRKRLGSLLESKVPPLKAWAMNALAEDDILPAKDPESSMLEWARKEGFLSFGKMRESHLAEAIRVGSLEEARRAMANGGLSRIPARMAAILLDAFALRQQADGEGLSAEGVAILWESSDASRILDKIDLLGPDALEMIAELAFSALSDAPAARAELLDRVRRCKSRKLAEAFESKLKSKSAAAPAAKASESASKTP